jgi:hypothetical protein
LTNVNVNVNVNVNDDKGRQGWQGRQ